MPKGFVTKPWIRLTAVMLVAGLMYSSWPLGYWLNPSGTRGLASNLEGLHQPYNWVFILLDVLCGALIIAATWWLLRFIRKHKRHTDRVLLESAVVGMGIFGFLTALDAVLPLNCNEATQHCLPPLEDPYFVVHGIVSIASIAGLTLSIIVVWWMVARDKRAVHVSRWVLHLLLFVWFSFGVGTAVLVVRDRSSSLSQHAFILFCSLWLAVLPYYIWNTLHLRPHLKRTQTATQPKKVKAKVTKR